eukprot:4351212-Pyramimonas_sp.AAC.1
MDAEARALEEKLEGKVARAGRYDALKQEPPPSFQPPTCAGEGGGTTDGATDEHSVKCGSLKQSANTCCLPHSIWRSSME